MKTKCNRVKFEARLNCDISCLKTPPPADNYVQGNLQTGRIKSKIFRGAISRDFLVVSIRRGPKEVRVEDASKASIRLLLYI